VPPWTDPTSGVRVAANVQVRHVNSIQYEIRVVQMDRRDCCPAVLRLETSTSRRLSRARASCGSSRCFHHQQFRHMFVSIDHGSRFHGSRTCLSRRSKLSRRGHAFHTTHGRWMANVDPTPARCQRVISPPNCRHKRRLIARRARVPRRTAAPSRNRLARIPRRVCRVVGRHPSASVADRERDPRLPATVCCRTERLTRPFGELGMRCSTGSTAWADSSSGR